LWIQDLPRPSGPSCLEMLLEVKVSLTSFLLAVATNCWLLDPSLPPLMALPTSALVPGIGVKAAELLCLWRLDPSLRAISATAYSLGLAFLAGLVLANTFGLYLAFLAFFHLSEYLATGLGNPKNLSFDSYLVNHSLQYGLAMVVSWLEHGLELWLAPSLKACTSLTLVGAALCLAGEVVRKAAMLEAGRSFNHLVQSERADDHTLVTSGIYSWCRHPSYAGWFLWSLGSQLILVNPLCLLAYAYVSFTFFSERIYVEEFMLLKFFGDEYRRYQARVGTGIPGIRGFQGPMSQVGWGGDN